MSYPLEGEHDHENQSETVWEVNDLGVKRGMRRTNTTVFIVREVGEETLKVSYGTEFPGEDAGDGFLEKTEEIKKIDVVRIKKSNN